MRLFCLINTQLAGGKGKTYSEGKERLDSRNIEQKWVFSTPHFPCKHWWNVNSQYWSDIQCWHLIFVDFAIQLNIWSYLTANMLWQLICEHMMCSGQNLIALPGWSTRTWGGEGTLTQRGDTTGISWSAKPSSGSDTIKYCWIIWSRCVSRYSAFIRRLKPKFKKNKTDCSYSLAWWTQLL